MLRCWHVLLVVARDGRMVSATRRCAAVVGLVADAAVRGGGLVTDPVPLGPNVVLGFCGGSSSAMGTVVASMVRLDLGIGGLDLALRHGLATCCCRRWLAWAVAGEVQHWRRTVRCSTSGLDLLVACEAQTIPVLRDVSLSANPAPTWVGGGVDNVPGHRAPIWRHRCGAPTSLAMKVPRHSR
jgi:hypothetical protein